MVRLQNQMSTDEIALTGMGIFTVNRSFILVVSSWIIYGKHLESIYYRSVNYYNWYLGGGAYIIIPINLFLSLFFWHVSTLKSHLQRVTRNERTVINSNFGKDSLTKLQKLIFIITQMKKEGVMTPLRFQVHWMTVLATCFNRP